MHRFKVPGSLVRTARRLAHDRRGAIAPMFAMCLIPLLIAGGVGIDLARLVSSRNSMQDALDATALALGREPAGEDIVTLNTKARAWLTANLTDKELDPSKVVLVVHPPIPGTGKIVIDASTTVDTTLTALAGVQTLPVSAHSTVNWGFSHIELALVLDNTGSMAQDNKLQSLKDAANTLVDTLSASAAGSGDANALKIGVVPFSMTVNVGSGFKGQSWLTGTMPSAGYGGSANDVVSGADRFALFTALGKTWGGCIESRPMDYDISDIGPTTSNPATLFVPFFAPDEPDSDKDLVAITAPATGATYRFNSYSNNPNDYLADGTSSTNWRTRQGNKDKYVSSGLHNTGSTSYWGDKVGPNAGCQVTSMLPLTSDMTAVRSKLGQMIASGDTEIPLGLAWGWHLLSPNFPFGNNTPYQTPSTVKVVVLVTDGQNTYSTGSLPANLNGIVNGENNSFYTAYGYQWQKRITPNGGGSTSATALNDRLAKLCTNMHVKNADGTDKVVIYTVPVEVTDPTVKTLLQNCATSPDKYIDVSSSSGLTAAFANIAGSIGNLRVSH